MTAFRARIHVELAPIGGEWRVLRLALQWGDANPEPGTTQFPKAERFIAVVNGLALLRLRWLEDEVLHSRTTAICAPDHPRVVALGKRLAQLMGDARRPQEVRKIRWVRDVFGKHPESSRKTALDAIFEAHAGGVMLNRAYVEPSRITFCFPDSEERNGLARLLRHAGLLPPPSNPRSASGADATVAAGAGASVAGERGQVNEYVRALMNRLRKPKRFMGARHDGWRDREDGLCVPRRLQSTSEPCADAPGGHDIQSALALNAPAAGSAEVRKMQSHIVDELLAGRDPLQMCITGEAGMGKSTLLENFAWSLGSRLLSEGQDGPRRVPFIFDISEWREAEGFTNFVERCIEGSALRDPALFWRLCTDGAAVVLLDGFDQIRHSARRSRIASLLNDAFAKRPMLESTVILTSRPWAVQEADLELARISRFALDPLTVAEVEEYIRTYFQSRERGATLVRKLRSAPEMWRLIRTPLMLVLLCFAWEQRNITLPMPEIRLLQIALDELLTRRVEQLSEDCRDIAVVPSITCLRLLTKLAWSCWLTQSDHMTSDEALEVLVQIIESDAVLRRELGDQRPSTTLLNLAKHSGILARTHSGLFRFIEDTYLEYLAGKDLAESPEETVLTTFGEHSWDPDWQRVLAYAGALLWQGGHGRRALAQRIVGWLSEEHSRDYDDRWGTLAFFAARVLGGATPLRDARDRQHADRVSRQVGRAWIRITQGMKDSRVLGDGRWATAWVDEVVRHVVGDASRSAAPLAVGHLPRIVQIMLRATASEGQMKVAAMTLAEMDIDMATSALSEIISTSDDLVRRELGVRMLADLPTKRGRRLLEGILAAPEDQVLHGEAACALFKIDGTPVIDRLVEAIHDATRSLDLRHAAAQGLANIETSRSFAASIEVLQGPRKETDPCLRTLAASHLADAPADLTVAPLLVEVMREPQEHPFVRWVALGSLGRQGGAQAEALLSDIVRSPEDMIGNLSAFHDAVEVAEVKTALQYLTRAEDIVAGFRRGAIAALAMLGTTESLQPVKTILEGREDEELRAYAARAVGRCRTRLGRDLLIEVLEREGESKHIREALVSAIYFTELPCPAAAIAFIVPMLRDRDADPLARHFAAQVLGRCGSRAAVAALVDVLAEMPSGYPDAGRGFRATVEQALLMTGSKAAREAVESYGSFEARCALAFRLGISRRRGKWVRRRELRLHRALCPEP